MSPNVEKVLLEYQLNGLPRLDAIQQALSDRKLMRDAKGVLSVAKLGEEAPKPPSLQFQVLGN